MVAAKTDIVAWKTCFEHLCFAEGECGDDGRARPKREKKAFERYGLGAQRKTRPKDVADVGTLMLRS